MLLWGIEHALMSKASAAGCVNRRSVVQRLLCIERGCIAGQGLHEAVDRSIPEVPVRDAPSTSDRHFLIRISTPLSVARPRS